MKLRNFFKGGFKENSKTFFEDFDTSSTVAEPLMRKIWPFNLGFVGHNDEGGFRRGQVDRVSDLFVAFQAGSPVGADGGAVLVHTQGLHSPTLPTLIQGPHVFQLVLVAKH